VVEVRCVGFEGGVRWSLVSLVLRLMLLSGESDDEGGFFFVKTGLCGSPSINTPAAVAQIIKLLFLSAASGSMSLTWVLLPLTSRPA
jgi:hypothetical protein